MKESLYNFFVRRNEFIRNEYERYVIEHLGEHEKNRVHHWAILLRLNWHYRIRKKNEPLLYPQVKSVSGTEKLQDKKNIAKAQGAVHPQNVQKKDTGKKTKLPYLNGAESRSTRWMPPHDLVRVLNDYDVISFDIFDTLLFRPLELPRHVFWFVGNELNILNFINIRMNAENTLRDKKQQEYGHREVTIYEIYEQIEKETGLPADIGAQTEIETEMRLCYANPYMKYVFDTIKAQDKKICLVSDMYLPEHVLDKLLKKCGYEGYEKIIVSCDYNCSKRDGGLFQCLKDYVGDEEKKIIHVGDNPVTDIQMGQEKGLETYHYENVSSKGKKYRTDEVRGLVGSAYKGIVNNHLHNGYRRYDAYYEYGFIYGGLFMYGFANYIHKYAKDHGIEKVLFVARDGYVMKQVYDRFFSDLPTEYMLCSRISNLKMSAYCNKVSFLKEYVYRWTQEKIHITLQQVLENMELSELSGELEKYVPLQDYIDADNTRDLLRFIDDYWDQIKEIYEKTIIVAKKYYANYFENTKKVLVVDIGWRGQAILALRCLERDYWHFGCEIAGMLAASAPTHECQGQLQAGIMNTYMFSPIDNVSCFNSHSKISINNILVELFAGAPMPSFCGFKANGDNYDLEFDVPETANYETIAKVHQGIMDFAEIYNNAFKDFEYMNHISGYDAYMPIKHIFKDYSFIKRFFANYEFQDTVGGTAGKNSRTIRDIFRKFNL